MSRLAERIRGIRDGHHAFVGPEQVVIDPTNQCNNNCIACWTHSPLLLDSAPGPEWERQALSPSLLRQLVDDLADLGTERVRFTGGGEPLLHRAVPDVMARAAERGMLCSLTTNLTLIRPEDVDLFTRLPLDEIAVSLWAASARTYSRVHPNKTEKTFHRVRDSLEALVAARRGARPRITLCHVLGSLNYHEFDEMIALACELGIDALYFTLVDPIPGRTEGLLLRPEQQVLLLQRIEELRGRGEMGEPGFPDLEDFDNFVRRLELNDPTFGHYDLAHIDSIPCYVGWIFCRVTAAGLVTPCCRGVQKPLGDLTQRSFKEIWFSESYNTFRNLALTRSKREPYFASIGCGKTCDNLMHNQEMHRHLSAEG